MYDRLQLRREGANDFLVKLPAIGLLLYLLWLGILSSLVTSKVQQLQDRITALDSNLADMVVAMAKCNQIKGAGG